MSATPHILAIHGINTGLTNPAWPWRFAAFVAKAGIEAHVETEHYKAGPFPRWNQYIVNPPVAKALANRVLMRREILGRAPVHILAHSNGSVVALSVARRLAKAGVPVETLVLVAGAIHSDIAKSGLQALSDGRMLNRSVAFCSSSDAVVKYLQSLPGAYGSLGARGFEMEGRRVGFQIQGYAESPPFADFVVRRFDGFAHSEYVTPAWEQATYATALRDMGFDDVAPY